MKGVLVLFYLFWTVLSFDTFPTWINSKEHMNVPLNKARVEIVWKIFNGAHVINTDAMNLDKGQVERLIQELNALNISATDKI